MRDLKVENTKKKNKNMKKKRLKYVLNKELLVICFCK